MKYYRARLDMSQKMVKIESYEREYASRTMALTNGCSMTCDLTPEPTAFWQSRQYTMHGIVLHACNPLIVYFRDHPPLEIKYPTTCRPFVKGQVYHLHFTVQYNKGTLEAIRHLDPAHPDVAWLLDNKCHFQW